MVLPPRVLEIVSMKFSALEGTDLEYDVNVCYCISDNAGLALSKSSIFKWDLGKPTKFEFLKANISGNHLVFFFGGDIHIFWENINEDLRNQRSESDGKGFPASL